MLTARHFIMPDSSRYFTSYSGAIYISTHSLYTFQRITCHIVDKRHYFSIVILETNSLFGRKIRFYILPWSPCTVTLSSLPGHVELSAYKFCDGENRNTTSTHEAPVPGGNLQFLMLVAPVSLFNKNNSHCLHIWHMIQLAQFSLLVVSLSSNIQGAKKWIVVVVDL